MTTPTPEPTQTPAPEAPAPETTKGEFVPRETYEKAINENKNWREKAKANEAKLQAMEMAQMEKDNNLKGINEALVKKIQEYETKIKEREEQETRAFKLTKVKQELAKLGLKEADALLDMVKVDAVKYEPELRVVLGAEEEAKRIFENLAPILKLTNTSKPNHDAPQGVPADVSIESYKRMLADGSFNKMTPVQQREYYQKLYQAHGSQLKK